MVQPRSMAEATELLKHAATPGCILLDLHLPDAQGIEAVTQLLSAAPLAPVVVLTGLAEENAGLAAVAAGAQDYLIRAATDAQALGRSIHFAIERKRSESRLAHQALHDSLTGLPNRVLMLDRLNVALGRSRRRPTSLVGGSRATAAA